METAKNNTNHLEMISIFHYALAGLIFLKGLTKIFFMGIGIIAAAGVLSERPQGMGIALFVLFLIFLAIPLLLLSLACAMAILVLLAGRYISTRKHLGYCQIIAAIECLCVPLGTILGIFTFMQLTKPEVKETFKQ